MLRREVTMLDRLSDYGRHLKSWPRLVLLGWTLAAAVTATGCQTTVGGQTLPSGYYLRDDVQFFPAGPEFLLSNKVQAMEQYKLEQQALQEGLAGEGL